MVVYKYYLRFEALTTLDMPKGGKILSVQIQRGRLCLWALCHTLEDNQEVERENRHFRVVGTGAAFSNEPIKHLATVQSADDFVWHVFEVLSTAQQFAEVFARGLF